MKTKLFATRPDWSVTVLRITLGVVVFSHGAQAMLGWFGGGGLGATLDFLTTSMHLPWIIALFVICIQFVGALMLVAGMGTRVAALGVAGIFIGMATYHFDYGFHMNWSGANSGEGFEYHVLVVAMCAMLLGAGGGALSLDLKLVRHRQS